MHRFACAAATMLLASCTTSPSSFECSTSTDCGSDGRCEPTGFCSFPDSGCASGYRYGDLAESLSNQCVIEEGTGSTSVDPGTSGSTGDDSESTSSSSSPMESTSSTTTDDPTLPIGDSSSGTLGVELFCLMEEFDGPPGAEWFLFSESGTPISIEDGQLLLPIDPTAGDVGVVAGMRSESPANLQAEGWAQTTVTAIPSDPQMTMALSLNDETSDDGLARSIRITDNSIRVESFENGMLEVLAAEPYDDSALPVTLEILAFDDVAHYLVSTEAIGLELYVEPIPSWFAGAYVTIDAGNPTSEPPDGVPSFERIEVCGGF